MGRRRHNLHHKLRTTVNLRRCHRPPWCLERRRALYDVLGRHVAVDHGSVEACGDVGLEQRHAELPQPLVLLRLCELGLGHLGIVRQVSAVLRVHLEHGADRRVIRAQQHVIHRAVPIARAGRVALSRPHPQVRHGVALGVGMCQVGHRAVEDAVGPRGHAQLGAAALVPVVGVVDAVDAPHPVRVTLPLSVLRDHIALLACATSNLVNRKGQVSKEEGAGGAPRLGSFL